MAKVLGPAMLAIAKSGRLLWEVDPSVAVQHRGLDRDGLQAFVLPGGVIALVAPSLAKALRGQRAAMMTGWVRV